METGLRDSRKQTSLTEPGRFSLFGDSEVRFLGQVARCQMESSRTGTAEQDRDLPSRRPADVSGSTEGGESCALCGLVALEPKRPALILPGDGDALEKPIEVEVRRLAAVEDRLDDVGGVVT